MPKILIRKEKKEFIKDLDREVTIEKQTKYFVQDATKDYHCKDGFFSKKDLKKTGKIKTNKDKEFSILDASFIDLYEKIKRGAQIISLKDIGAIITYTGINKDSRIVDAGAGSGAQASLLAHICKEVTTYEIREDHYNIVNENKKKLDLKNLKVKNKDITKGIDEKNVDLITLDLPDPWKAIKAVEKALKPGGFLVNYSPNIPQVMDFVNNLSENDHFIHLQSLELIKREWEIKGRKVRPITTQNVHTGFLSFLRKI